jgi:hypothetical protein
MDSEKHVNGSLHTIERLERLEIHYAGGAELDMTCQFGAPATRSAGCGTARDEDNGSEFTI